MFTIIGMMILAILIIWCIYYITSNKPNQLVNESKSEVELLIKKDIYENYPDTPKEVLKLYFRITQCLYNQDMSDSEMTALASQLRFVLDEEVLLNNPESTFAINLKHDIDDFKAEGGYLSNYEVEAGSNADYDEIEGEQYATLAADLLIQKTKQEKN